MPRVVDVRAPVGSCHHGPAKLEGSIEDDRLDVSLRRRHKRPLNPAARGNGKLRSSELQPELVALRCATSGDAEILILNGRTAATSPAAHARPSSARRLAGV